MDDDSVTFNSCRQQILEVQILSVLTKYLTPLNPTGRDVIPTILNIDSQRPCHTANFSHTPLKSMCNVKT